MKRLTLLLALTFAGCIDLERVPGIDQVDAAIGVDAGADSWSPDSNADSARSPDRLGVDGAIDGALGADLYEPTRVRVNWLFPGGGTCADVDVATVIITVDEQVAGLDCPSGSFSFLFSGPLEVNVDLVAKSQAGTVMFIGTATGIWAGPGTTSVNLYLQAPQ